MKNTGKWMVTAMVMALMAILFSGCGHKTTEINLSDFYSIEIEGCNGSGTARVQFDEKAMEDTIFKNGRGCVVFILTRFDVS